ncbi:hypothetical protein AGLY_012434 [Aphis glycines]|uniref:Uncharacterized protein n=1 Tax=Aphis glycines TaxID=307491 RepID=A0A6G0TAF4_APHGL|nr:hypothetical protein AGLY_012434 [Aphis glycines]
MTNALCLLWPDRNSDDSFVHMFTVATQLLSVARLGFNYILLVTMGYVKCLLDGLEELDWIKDSDWRSNPNNGLKEAILWNTIPRKQKYIPNLEKHKPTIEYKSFEPEFISEEIKNDPKAPFLVDYQRVLVPIASMTPVTEELRNRPGIRALQAAANNGRVLNFAFKRSTDTIVLPK